MFAYLRLTVATVLIACLFVTACSGKEKSVTASKLQGYSHLQYVPADTTFAYMALAPLDEDVLELLEAPYAEMLAAYSDLLSTMGKNEQSDPAEELNPFLEALRIEFKDGVSLESFEKLGMDGTTTGVFFGHGVLPVLRLRMQDTDAFKDFVARIEKRAKQKLPRLIVDGMTVWHVDEDEVRIAFGVNDDDFVAAVMPLQASAPVINQLMGAQKPIKSLAETSRVGDLMKNKSYLPQGLGFIDTQQIVNRVTNPLQGVDQELAQLFGMEDMTGTLSAECKQELQSLAVTMPGLLFGLTRFDTDGVNTEMLMEVRPDLAAQMAGFTAPVPGLGRPAGLFSMGASFNIGEMQKFALRQIKAQQKEPFECEFLQISPVELERALATVSNPAAGMMQLLQGFHLVIDDMDVDAAVKLIKESASESLNPGLMIRFFQEHLGIHAVVAAKSTEALVGMASMMIPELGALDIKPNGPPVSVSNLLPLPLPVDILAAMSDDAFAFAIGKNADAALKLSLAEKSEKQPPLLSYSIDGQQYMKLLDAVLATPEVADAMSKDPDAEMSTEQTRRLIRAFYGLNGDVIMNVRMRADGIAMEQVMDFP